MRYFIEIAYNGKNYHGWQNQPDAISVQQTIEDALHTLFRKRIDITAAGRTDAGVHARQLFAHFDFTPGENVENLVFRLNAMLPRDILISGIFQVKENAHARFDALSRTYNYHIVVGKDPFLEDFAYSIYRKPDIEKMNEAAKLLMKYNDFQCFSKVKTDVKTFNCIITEAFWEERDNQLIFTVSANRFLRNMVRAIVGTLLEIGLEKLEISDLQNIINSKNRNNAGASVPAKGLYLTKVTYPKEIYI